MSNQRTTTRIVAPIFSLLMTFGLLYLLLNDVELFRQGDRSSRIVLGILFECLGLFFFPLLMGGKLKKTEKKSSRTTNEEKQTKRFNFKKPVRLNVHYSAKVIVKCTKCKFENPTRTKKCFNCGEELNF